MTTASDFGPSGLKHTKVLFIHYNASTRHVPTVNTPPPFTQTTLMCLVTVYLCTYCIYRIEQNERDHNRMNKQMHSV